MTLALPVCISKLPISLPVQELPGDGETEDGSTPSHLTESRWQARCAVLSLLATFLLHSPQVRFTALGANLPQ